MKEILLFGGRSKQDLEGFQKAFVLRSVRVSRIDRGRYLCPVGQLLQEPPVGMEGNKMSAGSSSFSGVNPFGNLLGQTASYQGPELPKPMMVLSGFSESELEDILAVVNGLPGGKEYLKAMLTEHNRQWNVLYLVQHLMEEHRRLTGR